LIAHKHMVTKVAMVVGHSGL